MPEKPSLLGNKTEVTLRGSHPAKTRTRKCPKCESTVRDDATYCPECDFPFAPEVPAIETLASKSVYEERGLLKSFLYRCSVGYFIAIPLLVAVEMIMGITPAPTPPGQIGVTILAIAGIVWGRPKKKSKGE